MKNSHKILAGIVISMFAAINCAQAGDTTSPVGAVVYFVNLRDGNTVSSPVRIVFGLKGMGVAPAGADYAQFPDVGHHHLFIDTPLTKEIEQNGIPADEKHIHFGKGQTETEISLTPGRHTLQLVFADPSHIPHKPVVSSEPITINVK